MGVTSLPKYLGTLLDDDSRYWFVIKIDNEYERVTLINSNADLRTVHYNILNHYKLFNYKGIENSSELMTLFLPKEDGWYEDKDGSHWLKEGDFWHWKKTGSDVDKSDNDPMYLLLPLTKIDTPIEYKILDFSNWMEQEIRNLDYNSCKYHQMLEVKAKFKLFIDNDYDNYRTVQ